MDNISSLLEQLEAIIRIPGAGDCCSCLNGEDLRLILERNDGNVNAAAYEIFVRRAQEDGLSLPDGTTLPSNRPYWLRMAKLYRPNYNTTLLRADEVT